MSDEITITVSGVLANTSGTGSMALNRTFAPGTAEVDQAAKKRAGESQGLTTSWETVDVGDITSGFVFLTNLDATYTVDYGTLDAGSGGGSTLVGTMAVGDPPALLHLTSGVTYMVRASGGSGATATVDVECWSK